MRQSAILPFKSGVLSNDYMPTTSPKFILGISAYYHDSAAALLKDGQIIAAAQEERFTRKKHDASFPKAAIQFCLDRAGIRLDSVDHVVFYDKPLLKFERLLETYLANAPRGLRSFVTAMPVWLKEKLYLKTVLKKEFAAFLEKDAPKIKILFSEHHQSHAASAFYPSPYSKAAVLCLDGVGEWATTSAWLGDGAKLTPLWQINFPHSLGLLYSAFTYYTGFKVNSGEYKVMGLAPYGEPKYVREILDHLIDLKEDGTFELDMSYFDYATGLKMINEKFCRLFGGPARKSDAPVTQKEMDLARSIQFVTEEIVLRLATTLQKETNTDSLCLAGGVALNCVANGRLLREGPFKHIWIQPAAGDAGGALGAALVGWHTYLGNPRLVSDAQQDSMHGGYLGPDFTNNEIKNKLNQLGAVYEELDAHQIPTAVAKILEKENVVGWFQGRMEFGPRALGARSILGDARSARMQSTMNLKIKYRESFRPFAPAVLEERVSEYFNYNGESPYMLMVSSVKEAIRTPMSPEQKKLFGIDKLHVPRSSIPAVTHVDYSARIQTVSARTNPRFHSLLKEFDRATGCPVLVNTSFNVRGEPIVCTPEDAYRCFMRTEMDFLVVENFILEKTRQPTHANDDLWKKEFELD